MAYTPVCRGPFILGTNLQSCEETCFPNAGQGVMNVMSGWSEGKNSQSLSKAVFSIPFLWKLFNSYFKSVFRSFCTNLCIFSSFRTKHQPTTMANTYLIISAVVAAIAIALGAAYMAGLLDPVIEEAGIMFFKAKAEAEAKKMQAQGMKEGEDFFKGK